MLVSIHIELIWNSWLCSFLGVHFKATPQIMLEAAVNGILFNRIPFGSINTSNTNNPLPLT
ncbi:MAG: hypothetical protein B0A82_08390 [Alkalinema sp. CACIAM 70d]|nr:MAG: hypothetical protein B0A82_08390 [Alkalinema sp. CACIAM 70d]